MNASRKPLPHTSVMERRRKTAKSEGRPYYHERRAQLVSAAATLFREKGFKETTLDDIARMAGTDRSSLYYYISDKQDLFYEVVTKAMEAITDKVEAIARSDSGVVDKLTDVVVAIMLSYESNYPSLFVYVQEDMTKIGGRTEHLADLGRRVDRVVLKLLKQGVAQGIFRKDISPRIAASAILGMVNWSHRWFKPNGAISGEEAGQAFAKIAVSGMLAPQ